MTLTNPQEALSNLVMFRSLPEELKQLAVKCFVPQSFTFGSDVVIEGEDATAFYVIVAGRAQVIKRGRDGEEIVLNTRHPGDNFGKRALVEAAKRNATVRALYTQPPIMIFDEATSALDPESENVIKENMGKLMQGRTSFVIAHRLHTIREADVILVLEKGRLAEYGSHEELMK